MKILIVDDEALSRTTLRQKLVSYGYTDCREAATGAEACALLDGDCPELIIADIRMPDLDGIELLQRVRTKGLDLLYILLSGFELFAYAQQALRHNAFAYLLKPEMYRMEETFVDVELEGSMTKGCTLVDLKGYRGKPANAKVCMDIDQEMFRAWFLESIGRCI